MREFQPAQYFSGIRPGMKRYTKRMRVLVTAAALLLAAGFLLFLLGMFFGGFERAAQGLFIAAGATFGPGALIGAICYRPTALANVILHVIEQAEARDRIAIAELDLPNASEEQKELVARRLVESGNLPGYALEGRDFLVRQ